MADLEATGLSGVKGEQNKNSPMPEDGQNQEQEPEKQRKFRPGEIAPFWYSSFPDVSKTLSEKAVN